MQARCGLRAGRVHSRSDSGPLPPLGPAQIAQRGLLLEFGPFCASFRMSCPDIRTFRQPSAGWQRSELRAGQRSVPEQTGCSLCSGRVRPTRFDDFKNGVRYSGKRAAFHAHCPASPPSEKQGRLAQSRLHFCAWEASATASGRPLARNASNSPPSKNSVQDLIGSNGLIATGRAAGGSVRVAHHERSDIRKLSRV